MLHKYLSSDSPVASRVSKKTIIDPELSDTVKSEENILTNVKTFIEATKRKRTDKARITMNVVTASISGKNLKSKTNLAKKIGVPRRRLSGGMRIQEHVFKSDKSCFKFSKRKIRNDVGSEEDKNLRMIFGFLQNHRA